MGLTDDQLKERRNYLGASEAAAAIGLSDWKSPLQLYREKIGEVEVKDEEEDGNLPQQVGQLVEPLVIAKLEQKKKTVVIERQRVFVDPKLPWRRVTVDGFSSVDDFLVEAKTAGFIGQKWGKDDTDEIPLQYVYQIQHGLGITERAAAWVPVIIGNTRIRIYRVDRDQELIDILTEGEKRFWWHVQNRVPPAASTKEDLKILYPYDNPKAPPARATSDIKIALTKFESNKGVLKRLEAAQEALYTSIGEAFGDAAELVDEAGRLLATFKSQAGRPFLDLEALEKDDPALHKQITDKYTKRGKPFRVLRPKKAKP